MLPIANFTNAAILAAYQQQFEMLESRGHKICLNVMDNQACKVIKTYLTKKECDNLLVKPNNHRVNAAKRAIQTFKSHFISALATTDSNFPSQLWDQLTPQVETTLNMLPPSQIDPTMSAYKAIHSPYDWNHFPLAPPGCKAVIYEAPESWGSWASHGTDAWYVGPSLDHYQCNHFFVPDTQAYWISGSAKLFPQHCQVPFLLWNEHLQEVFDELATMLNKLLPEKQARILSLVFTKLETTAPLTPTRTLTAPSQAWMLPRGDIQLAPYVPPPQQSVEQRMGTPPKQRVTTPPAAPIITLITDAPLS